MRPVLWSPAKGDPNEVPRYFRRLLLAGAFVTAAWAPAAGASTVDQVDGQLVRSSLQAGSQILPARLLPVDDFAQLRGGKSQIGGYSSTAVPQSYLAKLPSEIRAAYSKYQPVRSAATGSTASPSTFDWRDTVIGLVVFIAACAVLADVYRTRRRTSLRPA